MKSMVLLIFVAGVAMTTLPRKRVATITLRMILTKVITSPRGPEARRFELVTDPTAAEKESCGAMGCHAPGEQPHGSFAGGKRPPRSSQDKEHGTCAVL